MKSDPHPTFTVTSDETSEEELQLNREQGTAMDHAVEYMTREEAHGEEIVVGDYLIGYAVEDAEGLYAPDGSGGLEWREPQRENAHIEISVRNVADRRFLPGLSVRLTVLASDEREVGTHAQPFLWHPWLYHYGRNWELPGDGDYTFRIHVDPPTWHRHDRKNGRRFAEPVDIEFRHVKVKTGRKHSTP